MDQILHSKPAQLIPAMLLAAIVTFGLFYVMLTLIRSDVVLVDESLIKITDFVRVPEQQLPLEPRPRPTPPPEAEQLPEIPTVALRPTDITFTAGPTDGPLDPPTVIGTGFSDGAYLPLVKVQPNYPRNALARGIEGYTIVEFDVSENGSVRNPRVIEFYPSQIFNESSLKAVVKFRYKPTIENGVPIVVTGVQNRFTFELDEG